MNPPAAEKYQYWVNDQPCGTLEDFVEGATEHKGSWWPDWLQWLKKQDPRMVKAEGARIPGNPISVQRRVVAAIKKALERAR